MDVQDRAPVRLGAGHEVAQAGVQLRHVRRCNQDTALRVDDGQARHADARYVGADARTERRRGETGALGGDDQQIAQIAGLGRLVGHAHAVAAREGQFGRIELQRGVLGQPADRLKLAFEPVVHGRRARVRNDAKPALPSAQVALALRFDEMQGKRDHAGRGQRQAQHDRREHELRLAARRQFVSAVGQDVVPLAFRPPDGDPFGPCLGFIRSALLTKPE